MNELAVWDDENGDKTEFSYGLDPNNPHTWDGHRVFGCKCDVGYTGYDCSLRYRDVITLPTFRANVLMGRYRECPRGDDPGTYDDHVEVQVLRCVADGGRFKLGFRQENTDWLSWNATKEDVQTALMALDTLTDLTVTFINGSVACNVTGEVFMVVTFDTTHADLPPLKRHINELRDDTNADGSAGTGVIDIAVDGEALEGVLSIRGTTENAYCNNRGE